MEPNCSGVAFSVSSIALQNKWTCTDPVKVYTEKQSYFVTNRSRSSRRVKVFISKESDEVFRISKGYEECSVAAGLSMPVVLSYTPDGYHNHTGEIEIYGDSQLCMVIPIKGVLPVANLTSDISLINFGVQVNEHQTVSGCFGITNSGDLEGSFNLQTLLPSYLSISVSSGTLKPKASQRIEVKLLCNEVGNIDEDILFTVGSKESTTLCIHVKCAIIERALEVLDIQEPEKQINQLSFNQVYYGSVVTKKVVLFNNSPIASDFVINVDEKMSECVNKSQNLALALTKFDFNKDEQETAPCLESIFKIHPQNGTLNKYEKRLIEFTFAPRTISNGKGWNQNHTVPSERDYNVLTKFIVTNKFGDHDHESCKVLALIASARPVQIKVAPEEVDFGCCISGRKVTKDIKMTNVSSSLPLKFKCQDLAHYHSYPRSGVIKKGGTFSIKVTFEPKQLGRHKFQLVVQFCGPESKVFRKESVIYDKILLLVGHCVSDTDSSSALKSQTDTIADPGDAASSVRPWTRNRNLVTQFTKIPRYTYWDRDYNCTAQEQAFKSTQKEVYSSFMRQKRSERLWKEKEKLLSAANHPEVDLGMAPPECDMKISSGPPASVHSSAEEKYRISEDIQLDSTTLEYCENRPTHILDKTIINECRKIIPPTELGHIVIDPLNLSFGNIVVKSSVQKEISVKNFTFNYISVKLEIHCAQLRCCSYPQKSAISFVLRPRSYTSLQFAVRPIKPGTIEGSLKITLNNCHARNVPVCAIVRELSLELSSKTVYLSEQCPADINTAFWGFVEVKNDHDVPVLFKWLPRSGAKDFFALQSSGTIPCNTSMMCGFAHIPSFGSPSSSGFVLHVSSTDIPSESAPFASLMLEAKFQKVVCSIQHRRILFGLIPLNLISSQFTLIENKSSSLAFFTVADLGSNLNLKVSPSSGCIPGGGAIRLEIQVCPSVVGCFDVKVCVLIRGSRQLSVRLSGSVEQPRISVDKEVFDFGGVLCGSMATIPYLITNEGSCQAELSFDFAHLQDFGLKLPSEQDLGNGSLDEKDGGVLLKLQSQATVKCVLEFKPCEIAAYDFFLTVLVNGLKPPSPPASAWPPSNTHSSLNLSRELESSFSQTPVRRVMATVLQSPLLIANSKIEFSFPAFVEMHESMVHEKCISFMNVSDKPLQLTLDVSQVSEMLQESFYFTNESTKEVLTFNQLKCPVPLNPGESYGLEVSCHTSQQPCSLDALIPVLLNENLSPYCDLTLSVKIATGSITVNPGHIIVQPVPLGITVHGEFLIVMEGFARAVDIDISVPVCEDYVHFMVDLSDRSQIVECENFRAEVPCTLEFCSTKPVSKTDFITIIERNSSMKCKAPFTVSADNSMFTVYEFFSRHLETSVIKLDEEGIPVFHFQGHSVSNKIVSPPASLVSSESNLSAGIKYGQMYCQDCVTAACHWIASYGGPAVRCVKSPSDFRVKVKEGPQRSGQKQRSFINSSRGMLVDMLIYLCGRSPPGIPANLPECPTVVEKIQQLHSTYNTVLMFLKNQGAILSSVIPEALLDYRDYIQWASKLGNIYTCPKDEEQFNVMSNESWTCVLMQVIKVLVLPHMLKVGESHQEIGKDFKCVLSSVSNIYSVWERTLLAWLNHHYKLHRETLFGSRGSLTEVVNFDVDLMDSSVICCVLYSYCPFLRHSHVSKLFIEPYTPEQCAHNAIVMIDALRYIGIKYNVQQNDICSPNPIFMCLLSAHLYFNLPAYKPQDSIKFSTSLTKTDEVKIKIANRNAKDVSYSVLIRGSNSSNFKALDSVTVASRSSNEVAVVFSCSSLFPAKAYLYLLPHGAQASSTISYLLLGSSTGANAKVQRKIDTPLYKQITFDLAVTSPFPVEGKFKVLLYESENSSLLRVNDNKSSRGHATKPSTFIAISYLQKRSDDGLKSFHVNNHSVCLKPNSQSVITMQFIPLKLAMRHCSVVLSNPNLGDIVCSVTGVVNKPIPLLPETVHQHRCTVVNSETRTLHLSATTDVDFIEDIIIHDCNIALENALLEVSKWELDERDVRRSLLTESLHYAALSRGFSQLHVTDFLEISKTGSEETIVFSIEKSGDRHFNIPSQVNVPTSGACHAVLPVQFHAETEGHYECHILLRSGYDMRTICIEATVTAEEKLTEIEFHTQAIQPLTQNIPVVNPSTVDWPLHADMTNSQFVGPSVITARALSTTCYPLTFSPQMEGDIESELKLVNELDHSERAFKLVGKAGKPLAHDQIVLKATVKQRMTHIIHVPNLKERTITFNVESDLDFISGPSEITIGGNDIVEYPLTVQPKSYGMFTGALMFVAKTPNHHSLPAKQLIPTSYYIWFQVECEVDHAPPDKSIAIECPIFSSKCVSLPVQNPCEEEVTLEISIDGMYICGPDQMKFESLEKSSCDITFSPLSVGKFSGRIVFKGSRDGEFWYEVSLEALNPQVVPLPWMECEVGRSSQQMITLSNPLDVAVNIRCNNSNTGHYTVTGLADGYIVVPSNSKIEVAVLFHPSTIGYEGHEVNLTFTSCEFGDQLFTCTGKGLMPLCMDTTTVYASINSASVHVINFANPLRVPVRVSILLQGNDAKLFFLLHKKPSDIFLSRGGSIDIPIMFAPEKMYRHKVTVVVITNSKISESNREDSDTQMKENLQWEYPIYGQPEVRLSSNDDAPKFVCQAKMQIDQVIKVGLVKSVNNPAGIHFSKEDDMPLVNSDVCSKYRCEVKCSDDDISSLISRSIEVSLLGQSVASQRDHDVVLVFKISFAPTKAFQCVCDLVISNTDGGLWILPIGLHALSAYPDDTIHIDAIGLNKESRVCFKLSSPTLDTVPFTAHLVQGSDSEIAVTPTAGALKPGGTRFLVTYKPTMYGKKHHAKFIVQCCTAEWCYEIIGNLPVYSISCHRSVNGSDRENMQ